MGIVKILQVVKTKIRKEDEVIESAKIKLTLSGFIIKASMAFDRT